MGRARQLQRASYPDGFLGGGNIILESNLTITQNAEVHAIVGL